jgi:aminoglycoside 6'-N-acetyltransferase I
MPMPKVRLAQSSDTEELALLCSQLWPDESIDEHRHELDTKISSRRSGTLPVAIFVSEDEKSSLRGFVEVGLRSHADGCDTTHSVGFIEGWYVRECARGRGTGTQLMQAAEQWAHDQGCVEMASDALIENTDSHQAHTALGFEVVDRCVHFRKKINL